MATPEAGFVDFITDVFKLMRAREDISRAVSEFIDASEVASRSAAKAAQAVADAANDAAVVMAKARAVKDLVVKATD